MGRNIALALGSAVALVAALGGNGLTYTVGVVEGRLSIQLAGVRFTGPPASGRELRVVLAPQERYSTPQLLLADRGLLLNGLRSVWAAFVPTAARPSERRQGPHETRRYFHFNPFRASFTVADDTAELRLEVNVPDASIEAWQGPTKLQSVAWRPPWLQLILTPLAAVLALACLLLWPWRRREEVEALPAVPAAAPRSRPRWWEPVGLGVAGGVAVGVVFHATTGAVPGFGDEMNYLMQARIFASGRCWVPEPPLAEFFRVSWMDMFGADGKVWGFHPPGNSAWLAWGWLVGCYWLPVPVLAGIIFAVQYLLGWEVFGHRRWALVHLLLFATSHYVLAQAASFMAHPLSLALLSVSFLAAVRHASTRSFASLLVASAAAGAAFVVRPLSAVLYAVPMAIVLLPRRGEGRWRAVVGAAAAGLAVASLVFVYTWCVTGRFTLPYAVKGPEAGKTLMSRLGAPWPEHGKNLHRNLNELQHRVHSGGILLNFLLPALALVGGRRTPGAFWVGVAGSTFAFFAVAHSLLHWYGWKWEPRMLYDVSFLLFLAATAGWAVALRSAGRPFLVRLLAAAGGLALVLVAVVDLPRRFASEYRNYNAAPRGVMEALRQGQLANGVVFIEAELPFSCYTPFNTPDFNGDPLFARHQGDLLNYRLLARFPRRRAWFSPDGQQVAEVGNFYRRDLAVLAAYLQEYNELRPIVVVPWLAQAPSPLLFQLPALLVDADRALEELAGEGGERLLALLPGAEELVALLDALAAPRRPAGPEFETGVQLRLVDGPLRLPAGRRPGLRLTCWEGTSWSGRVLAQRQVLGVRAELCPGVDRSLLWEAEFELPAARELQWSIASDDGAGLFLNGTLVLDNGLEHTHGVEERSATVLLPAGRHRLALKYFNGPGAGVLRVNVGEPGQEPRPLTALSLGLESWLEVATSPTGGQRR